MREDGLASLGEQGGQLSRSSRIGSSTPHRSRCAMNEQEVARRASSWPRALSLALRSAFPGMRSELKLRHRRSCRDPGTRSYSSQCFSQRLSSAGVAERKQARSSFRLSASNTEPATSLFPGRTPGRPLLCSPNSNSHSRQTSSDRDSKGRSPRGRRRSSARSGRVGRRGVAVTMSRASLSCSVLLSEIG